MVDKDVKNLGGGKMSDKRKILKKISIPINIQYLQSTLAGSWKLCVAQT